MIKGLKTVVKYFVLVNCFLVSTLYAANDAVKLPPNGVVELVSLDMPAASLREIVRDADHYGIPVVIRGLLNNNWQLTAQTIYSIIHPDKDNVIPGGIEIDPMWFKQFGITQVPALVVMNGRDFDVVYGNIPLKNALSLIADKGSVGSNAARSLLKSGSGEGDNHA